ncbi:MAG: RNA-binding protein [Calditrichae bacterium]|nr:RNA-binding protein [Calditrichia bacterium]
MNIYVGNLPKTSTADDVRKAFEGYGEVTSVNLVKDKFSQEVRGFAFVEMPSKKEAQDAIQNLNGSQINSQNIVVNEAKPKKSSGSGNRGGYGGGGRRW